MLVQSQIQPQRKPLIVIFAVLTFSFMTMLILGVVMVARIGKVTPIPDLPERYLPGSPLLAVDVCRDAHDAFGHYSCEVYYQGEKVALSSWSTAGTISYASMSVSGYTIGDLITMWGTPSGVTHNSYYTYVYWGKRSAFLLTNSFQHNSQVHMIIYTLEQMRTSPWRGFITQAAER